MVNWLRKYIAHAAMLMVPLMQLIKKKMPTKVQWTEECQKTFDRLKQAMAHAPRVKKSRF